MIALQIIRDKSRVISKLANHINFMDKLCHSSMSAWRIKESVNYNYINDISGRLIHEVTSIPIISSPWEILVKVHSSSINPLDMRMINGYGRRVLDLLSTVTNLEPRITNDRFPLILGRDFSGEVIATGHYASNFRKGDLIYGAIEPQRSGAHAQYVTVPSYCVAKRPVNLSHNEASSIPFTALTAYSALCSFGNLKPKKCVGKQILVIGGSGGVGTIAIQLLKLWGANVTATCSKENTEWLENTLFVDKAIDYLDTLELDSYKGKFDFILDCGNYETTQKSHQEVVERSSQYLKPYNRGVYVTLSPPILNNADKHGMIVGTAKTLLDSASDTFKGIKSFNSFRWAFFLPNKKAFNYITQLYETNEISPQVHSIFSFNELPRAYEELQKGKVKGKVVVAVS